MCRSVWYTQRTHSAGHTAVAVSPLLRNQPAGEMLPRGLPTPECTARGKVLRLPGQWKLGREGELGQVCS